MPSCRAGALGGVVPSLTGAFCLMSPSSRAGVCRCAQVSVGWRVQKGSVRIPRLFPVAPPSWAGPTAPPPPAPCGRSLSPCREGGGHCHWPIRSPLHHRGTPGPPSGHRVSLSPPQGPVLPAQRPTTAARPAGPSVLVANSRRARSHRSLLWWEAGGSPGSLASLAAISVGVGFGESLDVASSSLPRCGFYSSH